MDKQAEGQACVDAREWVLAYIDAFVQKTKRTPVEASGQQVDKPEELRARSAPR